MNVDTRFPSLQSIKRQHERFVVAPAITEEEFKKALKDEEFRLNNHCPECNNLIPQYIIRYPNGGWDTSEECSCGYKSDYKRLWPYIHGSHCKEVTNE